jgi:hypothetical protein
MRHHDRPWKCGFTGCEFQEGGFLSRNMRDEHLDRFHQENGTAVTSFADRLDIDEIQPLLFDLVKANDIQMVNGLLKEFRSLNEPRKQELRKCAARFGSPSIIDLITEPGWVDTDIIIAAIEGNNLETFRHLLPRYNTKPTIFLPTHFIVALLRSDNEELMEEWWAYSYIVSDIMKAWQADPRHWNERALSATAGKIHGKQLLIRIWKKHILRPDEPKKAGQILAMLARTTCSTELAKVLMDHGAPVDYRTSSTYPTPLIYAARLTTAAAAELMKLLLFRGADPEVLSGTVPKIQELKGAKKISKWLGISWDELVAQAKEHLAVDKSSIGPISPISPSFTLDSASGSNQSIEKSGGYDFPSP